jgi:hypothetical protein
MGAESGKVGYLAEYHELGDGTHMMMTSNYI